MSFRSSDESICELAMFFSSFIRLPPFQCAFFFPQPFLQSSVHFSIFRNSGSPVLPLLTFLIGVASILFGYLFHQHFTSIRLPDHLDFRSLRFPAFFKSSYRFLFISYPPLSVKFSNLNIAPFFFWCPIPLQISPPLFFFASPCAPELLFLNTSDPFFRARSSCRSASYSLSFDFRTRLIFPILRIPPSYLMLITFEIGAFISLSSSFLFFFFFFSHSYSPSLGSGHP